MPILIFIGIAAFIAANILVRIVNAKTINPFKTVMSEYLTTTPSSPVKWWQVQDAGFFVLAAVMPLVAIFLQGDLFIKLPFWIVAPAIVGVVVTKWMIKNSLSDPYKTSTLQRLHIICAGIAFVGVEFGLSAFCIEHHLWNILTGLFTVIAPAAAFICYQFATANELDAYQELSVAGAEMAAILSIVIPFIRG